MQTIKYDQETSFGNLELLASQVVEGFITGLHKSPFHGFSVEFAEHRQYNNGDNVKNIDWKLYAKTDKLYSKRFEEETNLRCQFVIDVSSSMYFPEPKFNKLTFSIQAAASLMYLLKKQRDAFGLSLFSDEILLNTPAKSTTVHQKFLFAKLEELLETPKINAQTNLSESLHQVADLIHKRSLVVIFSDLFNTQTSPEQTDQFFDALQHLKFNKHEIVVFNVVDKSKEVAFEFENRPHHFIDMETGDTIKVHTNQVKENYVAAIASYRQQIFLKCAQYKVDLIDADINEGFYPVLQAYLIKRQKLG
ncbi:uncharacterized protein DUF58 [Pedobacter psychrotolerans]|uniref:Uncharacterized protein DUF58 n=1 Tax=Pedobacter psychrotolerans TaxID=1843235 RepID=A0A4R2H4N6_9SPHI|nr:DUF58 domain-containing protein [Pedobacter psychrotolerans]TCO20591.1 uncharacterized protein DUF58 [Pedobacter psychrotolerans]GGE66681.1 hypothetical protein GCM10011413_36500 [Pedobacter psychrotolerans]